MNDKRKRRGLKVQERKRHDHDVRRYQSKYPLFEFENIEGAPINFVNEVKKAVRKINFDDFPIHHQNFLSFLRHDHKKLIDELKRHDLKRNGIGTAIAVDLGLAIGQRIIDEIGFEKLMQWIPYSFPWIQEFGSTIKIKFATLKSEKGQNGTIYYRDDKSKVTDEKGDIYTIGWSRHSIDQICKRLTPKWLTYGGLGSVFSFFCDSRQEFCDLNDGQEALTFFDTCIPRLWSSSYVNGIIGEKEMDPNFDYFYRIGYSPIVREGRFIKILTLLCPGYSKTPEHKLVKKMSLSSIERIKLLSTIETFTSDKLYDSMDFSILKMFHDGGIPQIMKIPNLKNKHAFGNMCAARILKNGLQPFRPIRSAIDITETLD